MRSWALVLASGRCHRHLQRHRAFGWLTMRVRKCVRMCACARVCVCACGRVGVWACVWVWVCGCGCVGVCVCVCV